MKLTQAAFAQGLNVSQTTISQYENGTVVPSVAVLIRIHRAARSPEKEVIGSYLAGQIDWPVDNELVSIATKELGKYERKSTPNSPLSGAVVAGLDEFVTLSGQIVSDLQDSPRSLNEILGWWINNCSRPGAELALDNAVAFLKVWGASADGATTGSEKRTIGRLGFDSSRLASGQEKDLWMRCPTTRKWFNTGSRMTDALFRASDLHGMRVDCSLCRMSHPLRKESCRLR